MIIAVAGTVLARILGAKGDKRCYSMDAEGKSVPAKMSQQGAQLHAGRLSDPTKTEGK
jgi:hypothetical protein